MANVFNTIFFSCLFIMITSGLPRKRKFIIDERHVCIVKTSCMECLRLSHCSWCPTEKKCFSRQLKKFEALCLNNTVNHEDYGLSLEGNAECSCNREVMEQNCYPPGVTLRPVCSNRGSCVCGKCMCNTLPDPNEPTKTVMGEYCEYDNFSCEGPRCNEGPYSISAPNGVEDGLTKTLEVEIPAP